MSLTVVEFEEKEIVVEMSGQGPDGKPGDAGYSPTVAIDKVGTTTTITIVDVNGTHTATIEDGQDGEPGTDGVSPTVSISKEGKVTTVTITDADGVHTATINDGEDGQPGPPGPSEWGGIGGDIADQTDLVNALAEKADADSVYTKTETDALLDAKADVGDSYTKDEEDALLADKADSADVYTKSDVDALVESEITTYHDDTKATVITETASGSIASFSDGSPAPVTALTVAIEPVQDLHGYDAPWPAGGGINKVNPENILITLPATITSQTNLYELTASERTTWTVTAKVTNNGSIEGRVNIQFINNGSLIFGTNTVIPVGTTNQLKSVTYDASSLTFDTIRLTISGASAGYSITVSDIQINEGSAQTQIYPYSNICPISGHTSATVTRTGKNLLDCTKYTVTTQYRSSVKSILPNKIAVGSGNSQGTVSSWARNDIKIPYNKGPITVTLSGKYNCRTANTSSYIRLEYGTNANTTDWGDVTEIVRSSGINTVSEGTFSLSGTIPEGAFLVIGLSPNATASTVTLDGDFEIYDLQLELGSSASAYEPYQGQTVTIDLDGTRYGGSLNVLTGEMTVTDAMDTFDGDENITVESSDGLRISYALPLSYARKNTGTSISDMMSNSILLSTSGKNTEADRNKTTVRGAGWSGASLAYLLAAEGTLQTVDAVKAYLQEHPLQLVYRMNTPITVQLSPSTMQTLLGQNHIWSDTGDTSVTYRADTKLYIQKLTKPTEDDMIANANIAANTFFMVGNSLYFATSAIATGTTIVPGSNCTALSLADALNTLNA